MRKKNTESGFGRFPDGEMVMRFDLGVEKEVECFRKGESLGNDKYFYRFKRETTAGTFTQRRTAIIMMIIIPVLILVDYLRHSSPCMYNLIRAGHQRQHKDIDDKEV